MIELVISRFMIHTMNELEKKIWPIQNYFKDWPQCRFLGALFKQSLYQWSGARDGRKSFPAAGEDRYSFSFICFFTSILLNNSQILLF